MDAVTHATQLSLSWRILVLVVIACFTGERAVAESAEFVIKDDPALDSLVAEVRAEFLAKRAQNQPQFTRLDATVLVPEPDGSWRRGSHGGDSLHYPASCVKLGYMAAAAYWERVNGQAVGFLEPHVGPMIRVSDNVATGRVVDAITSTTNWNGEPQAPPYDQWKSARMFTMDYLSTRGLLENQIIHVKTYPTNSSPSPAGYEQRMWKEVGRNAMQTRASASLLLEIVKGKLEPRSTEYMRQLLTHDQWGDDSVLGFGVPPGAIYENKPGRAFDTLADFAYVRMPDNGREMILTVLTNAYADSETSQPRPYHASVLGPFAESMIERLGMDAGAPPKVKRDNRDANHFSRSGDWITSTAATEKWGADYLISRAAGKETAVTWRLAVPQDGLWEICVWYPQGTDLATDAPYAIQHADGETTVRVNQRNKGGRWVKLGDFALKAGEGAVRLSSDVADTTCTVAADAVKATMWPKGKGHASVANDLASTGSVGMDD